MHRWLPPPAIVALAAWAMWALARRVEFGRFAFWWQRALALVLLAAGLALMGAALVSFMRARTSVNPLRPERAARLITAGAFRLSRNPIYLGDALLLAALAVWLGNALNFGLVALFVFYIDRWQIRPEEAALARAFGQAYFEYRARVRRWL